MLRHAWAASTCLLCNNISRASPLSDIVARIGAITRCVRLSLAARRQKTSKRSIYSSMSHLCAGLLASFITSVSDISGSTRASAPSACSAAATLRGCHCRQKLHFRRRRRYCRHSCLLPPAIHPHAAPAAAVLLAARVFVGNLAVCRCLPSQQTAGRGMQQCGSLN